MTANSQSNGPSPDSGANGNANGSKDSQKPGRSRLLRWTFRAAAGIGIAAIPAGLVGYLEVETSFLSSQYLTQLAAGRIGTQTKTTVLCDNFAAAAGPFDERRGYAAAPDFCKALTGLGWKQVSKDVSWQDRAVMGVPLYPIYPEKLQAGMALYDANGILMDQFRDPLHVYAAFEDIPPEFVHSLLFVENKNLLGDHAATLNPAIEWPRLLRATVGHVTGMGDGAGASTLATQLEKFKHSPDGLTRNARQKFQQMLTASTRPYEHGPDTQARSRAIALEYINGMPLSSVSTGEEIHGLADGLDRWMGEGFEDANALMRKPEKDLSDAEMARKGEIYRKALSLIMSVTMPSAFLNEKSMVVSEDAGGKKIKGREALDLRVRKYLPLLRDAGIISPRLYEATVAAKVEFTPASSHLRTRDSIPHKSVNLLRSQLAQMMKISGGLYSLDRIDGAAYSTLDSTVSGKVLDFLNYAKTPEGAQELGIIGAKLLPSPDSAARVNYAFTLYEITENGNVLRVEEDTSPEAMNLNRHVKAGFGSTAKARTYADYLEVVAIFHDRYNGKTPEELKAVRIDGKNNLARWALEYLADPETDKSLMAMQRASLQRVYSANPGEMFFTGGGLHPPFSNFDPKDNHRSFTVSEALYDSVNLPFIRIMRDIVQATMFLDMQIDEAFFTDPDNKQRREYLEKFVHAEGTQFLWRAWKKQSDKTPEELLSLLAEQTSRSPDKLAVIYRSLKPDESFENFRAFILRECKDCARDSGADEKQDRALRKKYDDYAPGKFDINDRGYLARPVHPLELWLGEYKIAAHNAAIRELHQTYSAMSPAALAAVKVDPKDTLTRWAVDFLSNPEIADKSLPAMLHAAQAVKMTDGGWQKAVDASAEVRLLSYKWLLDSNKIEAQNTRLHTILEQEAFTHIRDRWAKFGFPFEKMVPALDSALGVSSDKPEALATFIGIVQNGGKLVDNHAFTDIKLAENTPYWKHYQPPAAQSRQVMRPETAALVREGMLGVVEFGTGQRLKGVVKLSDGTVLQTGGKTGTDNQDYAVNPKRTMTFINFIGTRHFAVISAIMHDPKPNEKPTSGLVTQLMKEMHKRGVIRPVLDRAYGLDPNAAPPPPAPPKKPEPFRPS